MTIIVRALLVAVLTALGALLVPGDLRVPAACSGAAVAFALIGAESWISRGSARGIFAAGAGLLGGLVAALVVATTLIAHLPPGVRAGAAAILIVGFAWLGLSLGLTQAGAALRSSQRLVDMAHAPSAKIIDTSVIIDGRILDVIKSGFLEGTLVIPQFILRELQQVADSSDPLKRNRGRKGLDVLKAIQQAEQIQVELTDEDTPDIREVDGKLLWLAERHQASLLTNDYNLNKVAQLRGVVVLNVNDLANAVKPVVLPGESLTIQVIKEGKERNQGVGYLDDGTMVVVESGRRLIGQKVDVVVSSVIQTNAGKMIFATWGDEPEPVRQPARVLRRSVESEAPVAVPPPSALPQAPAVGER